MPKIKLLSLNTVASESTLSRVCFINELNRLGHQAVLFGLDPSPQGQCPFQTLTSFKPEADDLILLDGVPLQNQFDLMNISSKFFSFGRKQLALRLSRNILSYYGRLEFLQKNFKIIQMRPDLEVSYNKTNMNFADIEPGFLDSFVKTKQEVLSEEKLFLYGDICERNRTKEKIQNTQQKKIYLAGAITHPKYFKDNIVPLLHSKSKQIFILGFQKFCVSDGKTRVYSELSGTALKEKVIGFLDHVS